MTKLNIFNYAGKYVSTSALAKSIGIDRDELFNLQPVKMPEEFTRIMAEASSSYSQGARNHELERQDTFHRG